MLGIDFSCGSYQPTSERIMVLNNWYQTDVCIVYVRGRYEKCIVLGNTDSWSKGDTITRVRDEKHSTANTEKSIGMSKSINTDFILKSFCWIAWADTQAR